MEKDMGDYVIKLAEKGKSLPFKCLSNLFLGTQHSEYKPKEISRRLN